MALKSAAVLISGEVVDVQPRIDFETKKHAGVDIALATGNGFAEVRLDVDQERDLAPTMYAKLNLFGRAAAWSQNGGKADVRYTFLRLAEPGDLDKLISDFRAIEEAAKKAA